MSNTELKFRVDVLCSGGWQHTASFVNETEAYEYSTMKLRSRVWEGDECIALCHDGLSWHAPKHLRNCDGKPCECGEVPPLGSHAQGG